MNDDTGTDEHRAKRKSWVLFDVILVSEILLHALQIALLFLIAFVERILLSEVLTKPEPTTMDIVNNIIAPLLVAAITGVFGWLLAQRKIRRKLDAAPQKYVEELDRLISRAIAEGPTKAVVNARAIVAARNSLRRSLVSISSNLNSEIDRLATEIGEQIVRPSEPSVAASSTPDTTNDRAFQTIEVLSRVWPAKKTEIVVEIRKLLAELDLESKDFTL